MVAVDYTEVAVDMAVAGRAAAGIAVHIVEHTGLAVCRSIGVAWRAVLGGTTPLHFFCSATRPTTQKRQRGQRLGGWWVRWKVWSVFLICSAKLMSFSLWSVPGIVTLKSEQKNREGTKRLEETAVGSKTFQLKFPNLDFLKHSNSLFHSKGVQISLNII